MIERFHDFVIYVSRFIGTWFFQTMASIIATGYFLFIPFRVIEGARFYRAVFPQKSRLYHFWCVWKQYHSFTRVILDRMLLINFDAITYTSEGFDLLSNAVQSGKGGILLMSHMGNWDVAAHLLSQRGLRLLIYMGVKDKEKLEKTQKQNLKEKGIKVVGVDMQNGSPFYIVEGLNFIKDGGLVAMSGDMIWHREQRMVTATFLGHAVTLPAAPYILAQKTGVPLFLFFAFRTGQKKYHFSISSVITIKAAGRREQEAHISRAAQDYSNELQKQVKLHPFQWYHFKRFLGKNISV